MRRTLLTSEIPRATVTQADLDYIGSVTLVPGRVRGDTVASR